MADPPSLPAQTDAPVTILLADDDTSLARLLQVCLRKSGRAVIVAHDGVEAMASLDTIRESLRLLISDVEMPRMSGIELAGRVTKSCPGCAVLLISGKAFPREAAGHGWRLLAKPFRLDVFLEIVDEVLYSVLHAA